MITDFLKTSTKPEDLAAALAVLREFKACETPEEWVMIPFASWAKLEQLEEYLSHLVEGAELKPDTVDYMRAQEEEP